MARGLNDDEEVRPVVAAVGALAVEWDRANGDELFPTARVAELAGVGALRAFVTLPDDDDATAALRDTLRAVGGADLALGRIWEGHVNAVQLIHAYGDAGQRATLAADLAADRLFGVWNTEPQPGMRVERTGEGWILRGAKSFATGAGHLDRVLITAIDPDGAKRMIVVDIAGCHDRADASRWRVRGMRGTVSGSFDFEGIEAPAAGVIGGPGDYEREPRFSAGAWRFTAVQLGAAEALLRHLRAHLVDTGKADDPLQRARFGACLIVVRSAGDWVARAARLAERADRHATAFTLLTRGVVEDACLAAMEAATRGAGTSAFFEGSRIDRVTRDLGLYLRQPFPDQARDRAAAAWIAADRWDEDPWW